MVAPGRDQEVCCPRLRTLPRRLGMSPTTAAPLIMMRQRAGSLFGEGLFEAGLDSASLCTWQRWFSTPRRLVCTVAGTRWERIFTKSGDAKCDARKLAVVRQCVRDTNLRMASCALQANVRLRNGSSMCSRSRVATVWKGLSALVNNRCSYQRMLGTSL